MIEPPEKLLVAEILDNPNNGEQRIALNKGALDGVVRGLVYDVGVRTTLLEGDGGERLGYLTVIKGTYVVTEVHDRYCIAKLRGENFRQHYTHNDRYLDYRRTAVVRGEEGELLRPACEEYAGYTSLEGLKWADEKRLRAGIEKSGELARQELKEQERQVIASGGFRLKRFVYVCGGIVAVLAGAVLLALGRDNVTVASAFALAVVGTWLATVCWMGETIPLEEE